MKATFPGEVIGEELEQLRGTLARDEPATTADALAAEYRPLLAARRGVFELKLSQYLGLFQLACRVNEEWRKRVFRGERPVNPEMDLAMRGVFALWLGMNDALRERAEHFERHGLPLDGSVLLNLRLYGEEARKLLQVWQAPALSRAIGLRTLDIQPETAARLQALLEESPQH